MSISNAINIARTALMTQQRVIDVIGHNIANESTPGYTRTRLSLQAETPELVSYGQIGRGVAIAGLERMRDSFIDQGLRDELGGQKKFETTEELLGRVELLFGEPSDIGISASLDAFWNAWGDLSNDPSSSAARAALRNTTQRLTNQFHSVSNGLDALGAETQARLRGGVADANSFMKSISDLNAQIAAGESGGRSAPDLRDQRDLLLDKLAELVDIKVTENGGTLRVISGSTTLIEGAEVQPLQVRISGDGFGIGLASGTGTVKVSGGALGGLVDVSQTEIPGTKSQLDTLALQLVNQVNTVHLTGVTGAGTPAREFFDPTGLTAASIDLETDIKLSPNAIAAGVTAGGGDASLALLIAGLRETEIPGLGGRSIASFYSNLVTDLGLSIREANLGAEAQGSLVAALSNQRAGVSSVSIDEEMINLIGAQQAYAAATRVVSTADEMIRELLNMV